MSGNAQKARTRVRGAGLLLVAGILVAALGCARGQAAIESAPPVMPNGYVLPVWNGEPYDQAVAEHGQPEHIGERVRWVGPTWTVDAQVEGGLVVDLTFTTGQRN